MGQVSFSPRSCHQRATVQLTAARTGAGLDAISPTRASLARCNARRGLATAVSNATRPAAQACPPFPCTFGFELILQEALLNRFLHRAEFNLQTNVDNCECGVRAVLFDLSLTSPCLDR